MTFSYIPEGYRKGVQLTLMSLPFHIASRPSVLWSVSNAEIYRFMEWDVFETYSLRQALPSIFEGKIYIAEKVDEESSPKRP